MKHNQKSIFEQPPVSCPERCGVCPYYDGAELCGCRPHNFPAYTTALSDPKDRPLPMPLICPWWYMNKLLDKVSPAKLEEIKKERLHTIAANYYLSVHPMSTKERKDFVDHMYRRGGGGLIDFNLYPEVEKLYNLVREHDLDCTVSAM